MERTLNLDFLDVFKQWFDKNPGTFDGWLRRTTAGLLVLAPVILSGLVLGWPLIVFCGILAAGLALYTLTTRENILKKSYKLMLVPFGIATMTIFPATALVAIGGSGVPLVILMGLMGIAVMLGINAEADDE